MSDEAEKEKPMPTTPLALAWKWVVDNGKETVGFTIVMIAAVYMFENIMGQAKEARTLQADNIKTLTKRIEALEEARSKSLMHAEKSERLLEEIARKLNK